MDFKMTEHDKINHPAHYTRMSLTIEPIDLCELLPFCLGNACKYIMRAGFKEGESMIDDYKKAAWYLHRAIDSMQEGEDMLVIDAAAAHLARKFEPACPLLGYLFDFNFQGITYESAQDALDRIELRISEEKREE